MPAHETAWRVMGRRCFPLRRQVLGSINCLGTLGAKAQVRPTIEATPPRWLADWLASGERRASWLVCLAWKGCPQALTTLLKAEEGQGEREAFDSSIKSKYCVRSRMRRGPRGEWWNGPGSGTRLGDRPPRRLPPPWQAS